MYKKTEQYCKEKTQKISEKYTEIIQLIGEDLNREGLEKTFLWYFKNKMYYKFISKKDITLRLGKK